MGGLQDKLLAWTMASPDGDLIQEVNLQVEHLAEELYGEYEPTKGPYRSFWDRLEDWIESAKNEQSQRALFLLLQYLFFVGPRELDSLYRVAFNSHITRWLIEHSGIALDDPNLRQHVEALLTQTWFCPITDSMRINAFYHLNHITGRNYRPDWFSLAAFADPHKVDRYLQTAPVKYVVLLEDFVGTGDQIEPAIDFAGRLVSGRPTLVVPLVICPSGVKAAAGWEKKYQNINIRSILELRPSDFLGELPEPGEPTDFQAFRQVARDTFSHLLDGADPVQEKVYTPFGFQGTGALIVLATNCPDNTLPLIHHVSRTWKGLFPRASRI